MLACERLYISHCFEYRKQMNKRKKLPCAANPSRHMKNIESEKAIVVSRIADNAHTVSAGSVDNVSAVDTHVDQAIVGIDVTIVGRCSLIDIVHIARCRIGCLREGVRIGMHALGNWSTYGEEAKLLEPICRRIARFQNVAGRADPE